MIRPVLGTVAARVVITAMNLLLIIAAGQMLGAQGLGSISMLLLGVTIVLLLNHVVGGGGLVYVVPRHGVRMLLGPSYAWALVTAAVAMGLQSVAPLATEDLVVHVVALGFLQSLNSIHLNILLGRERIALQNSILVGQAVLQFAAFLLLLDLHGSSLGDYILATYVAHGATALVSGYFALQHLGPAEASEQPSAWSALFRQGGLAQGANLLQLLNYRAAYYMIEHFRGLGALGIFSVTTQLAESAWLVPKSIGGVLYSKMSNMWEAEQQRTLTLTLLKASMLVGALCSFVLVLLPEGLYTLVFGQDIRDLHPILYWMVPGLVAMSGSQVLSHYLSGTGRILHNTIGSGLGVLVTLPLGWFLIPRYGLQGAAMTASMAYTLSAIYQLLVFLRITGTHGGELLPHAGDRERVRQLWARIR